ncbi:M61 family metallopeptidase [Adhaeribacter rhizoryzae]|uniref:M61 family metallopeptidase n=1 Tax=Adhaeribacter rhizoryzae TaxID=2607907 RepID=A0A5M6DJB7_9BACT|nr:M61 family metallopeptidase [Adhaeribacter rhizoryzae]KAA5547581.1 M61 family metallopeptidase [Adhaeribacter rhizoryzae]
MIYYEISCANPLSSYLQIKTTFTVLQADAPVYLQLPAWRPGRYELQNFAQKIQGFRIQNEDNNAVVFKKVTKDRWEVQPAYSTKLTVSYNFYARQMDAGGSWIDENQLYVNPINCLLAVVGQEQEPAELKLNIPENWQIACGLKLQNSNILMADNYDQLVDSPLIASPTLKLASYEVNNIPFYIWIQGDCTPDWDRIIQDFTAFTQEQITLFGEFPVKDYYFLNQILPYKHYHGVEHGNSTVITLGPGELLMYNSLYKDFVGVSSHELFHTWNIKKIRPAGMMPYDYSQENYFRTGFVAEGITTYYGDYILARSGVYTAEEYFEELNGVLSKHFNDYGHLNYSVTDSSFDLWLDGYKPGVPDRKVSIYHKGALAAIILDLEIRRSSNNFYSLDTVMQRLWENFGKKGVGYTDADYQQLVQEIAGTGTEKYFTEIIYGTAPIQQYLDKALNYVGCTLIKEDNLNATEARWGFKTNFSNNSALTVSAIAPESPAYNSLSLDDELIALNGRKIEGNISGLLASQSEISLTLFRNKQLREIKLQADGKSYFQEYTVRKLPDAKLVDKANFYLWLKQRF